jgi:hypothetical protein
MHWVEAIVLIVAITSFSKVMRARYNSRLSQQPKGFDEAEALKNSALQREVQELRERVKVLERIATDERQSRALADEIDALK